MNKLKVLDLFSGIGGFSLGLERTGGFETIAFCENDIYCRKVLKKHWRDIPIFDDIKKLRPKKESILKNVDLICGGFPCQGVSVAGKKKGLNDDRSGLWKEFHRIIKEISPRYVIIENVANLRNLGLATVIKDLWKIGYECEWHIISARSLGACHLRERIWIIAYPERGRQWGVQSRRSSRSGREKKIRFNGPSDSGGTSTSNPVFEGLERLRCSFGVQEEYSATNRTTSQIYSGMPRLWRSFASEKGKQEWWSKTTTRFRDWWKIESSICRMADGVSSGLDKNRRERIRMLGNSIVPQIAELIGIEIIRTKKELEKE